MGVLKPDLIFKSIVPIIMAGILGIYGLIVAVILNNKGRCSVSSNGPIFNTFSFLVNVAAANAGTYFYGDGYRHLASGLVCGLSSLVRYHHKSFIKYG